jgi:tRNA(Arg) A34 adenosine deaminase TadA
LLLGLNSGEEVDMNPTVRCSCGRELVRTAEEEFLITVSPCPICMVDAKTAGIKELSDGIKADNAKFKGSGG